jgi:phosphatidylglycerophosphatase A
MVLATGFGTGYGPIAPGTWGSLPGLALAWGLDRIAGGWAVACGALSFALAGCGPPDERSRFSAQKDPGPVVVDEIAGQMVTLLFLPLTFATLVLGFGLFRVLDVLKPWPANRLESLPGRLGYHGRRPHGGVVREPGLARDRAHGTHMAGLA